MATAAKALAWKHDSCVEGAVQAKYTDGARARHACPLARRARKPRESIIVLNSVARLSLNSKVSDGFVVSTTSATELLALANSFRPWVVQAGQDLLENFIATSEGRDTLDAWILWLQIREKTVDRGMRDARVDTNFDLYFFPQEDRVLGIMSCEHRDWKAQWLALPGVSEYAYSSISGCPPEQSAEAWAARGEAWAQVLGNRELIEAGFKIKVSVDGGPTPLGLVTR